jgi:hypothetical protein
MKLLHNIIYRPSNWPDTGTWEVAMAVKSDVLQGFVDAQIESLLQQTRAEAQSTFPGLQLRQSTVHAQTLEGQEQPRYEQVRSQFRAEW